MASREHNPARQIPSVDAVLRLPQITTAIETHGRAAVTATVRGVLAQLRAEAAAGSNPNVDGIAESVAAALAVAHGDGLKAVINLTGTIIHTNLGRAALPAQAITAMQRAAAAPSNLEYDLASGGRGDRDDHVEDLIRQLTGAEAATVVNNNAAAVLLVLNTLALGKEVPVSRGELVEIGGSFRVPDVMARAGCRLIEVGTTNRTHARDYDAAVNADTALLMKVHTSNYEVTGFTKSVPLAEVAAIAERHGLPLVTDLGSGTMVNLADYGLPHEPTVRESLASGAALVTFSGDKLLGGPQAGIIAGDADQVAAIKRNPLKRALRVDKVTMAALVEVLKLYRKGDTLTKELPVLRLMTRSLDAIAAEAERLRPTVAQAVGVAATVTVVDCTSQPGSGSLPTTQIPSKALAIKPIERKGAARYLEGLSEAFRRLPTPVIGRISDGALILDLRCLEDEELLTEQLDHLSPGPGP